MDENNGRAVTLWVDPKNPNNAVFDRRLDLNFLLFNIPFAFPFTVLGVFALCLGLKALWIKYKNINNASKDHRWWQSELKSEGGWLYPIKNPVVELFVWGFVFNAVAIPITLLIYSDGRVDPAFKALTTLAPLAGLYLVLRCLQQLYFLKYFGNPAIRLELPMHRGETTEVLLHFHHMPESVTVECQLIFREIDRADGEKKTNTLWEWKTTYITQQSNSGWQQRFFLKPLDDLPESIPRDGVRYNEWVLRIKIGRWVNNIWLPVE